MSFRFRSDDGLVVISAEIFGPARSVQLLLAVDTGAMTTMVNPAALMVAGYDPAAMSTRVEVTTASGIDFAPVVAVERFVALGHTHSDFSVLAHTLPPSAGVDGLMGLDFLRGRSLTVDFRAGEITLH